jgi:hypothetical protein
MTAEYVMVLAAALTLLPVCAAGIRISAELLTFTEEVQDEVALAQLRNIMLTAYDIEFSEREISFVYQNRRMTLRQTNDHLILQPGTQIFFSAVDEVRFTLNDGLIFAVFERGNRTYEKALCQP